MTHTSALRVPDTETHERAKFDFSIRLDQSSLFAHGDPKTIARALRYLKDELANATKKSTR